MSHSTTSGQSEPNTTQFSIEKNGNKGDSPLISREEIVGTPFHKIILNNQWFISFGDYRITEIYPTSHPYDEGEILKNDMWWICLRVAGIMAEKLIEDFNQNNKKQPTDNVQQ